MKIDNTKEVVKVVHYEEVKELLESLYIAEQKEPRCYICGTKVKAENFSALIRKSGEILFCCDGQNCYRLFIHDAGGRHEHS